MNYQKIKLTNEVEVQVDIDARQTACKVCRKPIRFGITDKSKYIPISKIGEKWEVHFNSCQEEDKAVSKMGRIVADMEYNQNQLNEL